MVDKFIIVYLLFAYVCLRVGLIKYINALIKYINASTQWKYSLPWCIYLITQFLDRKWNIDEVLASW